MKIKVLTDACLTEYLTQALTFYIWLQLHSKNAPKNVIFQAYVEFKTPLLTSKCILPTAILIFIISKHPITSS